MSDAPGGEGWWQASDDKWYPPDARPEPPKPPPPPAEAQRRQRDPEFTPEELAARRAARDQAAAASTRRAQGVGCLAVLAILAILWAIGAALGGSGDDDSPDELQYGAFDVCTQFVKQRLTSPASARFPNEFEDDGEVTITSAGSTFTVVSHVDSQNGFGALLTTPFTCRVRHVDGDNWRLVDLQLVE